MDKFGLKYVLVSMRPRQWIKNGFIFLPIIFGDKMLDLCSLVKVIETIVCFCLMNGSIYIFNDIIDMEADKRHPVKKNRPLPAGRLSVKTAYIFASSFLLISLSYAATIDLTLLAVMIVYLTVQILYNYKLKDIVIFDIFCISFGFFLRIIAGAEVINTPASNWLIICSVLISLFLAMGKRRAEILSLNESDIFAHRAVLSKYSTYLLDQMINVVAGSIFLSYMLYCFSTDTIRRHDTDKLILTFPFVLYGIFRYLYLVHQKQKGGEPERVLLSDLPLLVTVILWAVSCVILIYI